VVPNGKRVRKYFNEARSRGVFRNLDALATAAGCSPRVLDKVLKSQPVQPKTVEKIEQALRGALGKFDITVESIVSYSEEQARSSSEKLKNSIEDFMDIIFNNIHHDGRGGIRTFVGDVSRRSAEQPWVSAQCLVALLKACDIPRARAWCEASDRPKLIRETIAYFRESISARVRLSGKPLGGGWTIYDQARDSDVECITEVNSWVVLALAMALRPEKSNLIWPDRGEARRTLSDLRSYLPYVLERQTPSGGWSPIDSAVDSNTRLYATIMALWALGEARQALRDDRHLKEKLGQVIRAGVIWLLAHRNESHGWVYNPNGPVAQADQNPGLNAQTIFVLMGVQRLGLLDDSEGQTLRQAEERFLEAESNLEATYAGLRRETPEDHFCLEGHDGPVHLEYSQFLGCPWALAVAHDLARDPGLPSVLQHQAEVYAKRLLIAVHANAEESGLWRSGIFELAENLICIAHVMGCG